MFVDTHAHLFFRDFERDIVDVIRRAEEAGVDSIVCPGTDLETSRSSIELAERFESVYAAVGFHPHDARKAADEGGSINVVVLDEIEKLSHHPKVVAIGEIGLDYHYKFSPPEIQRTVFSAQIAIARRRNLPIIIHCREAESETMRIVKEHLDGDGGWGQRWATGGGPHTAARGVFHCFPGDPAMARKVIDWGFYVSIPGPVTFDPKKGKSNQMVDVAREVSAEHLLLETDSPYLTPRPYRGKRNEPANIPFIAKRIAELQGLSLDNIARATSLGARRLFGIGGVAFKTGE